MKPVAFDYARPTTLQAACALLSEQSSAKIIAGGQSLGPMLNLRLAQPSLLIDITRIPELARVEETADAITLGAIVTHAAIEDRRVADPANGFLARVAAGIAYRAVRTRGTIGGSLAHADPAADWVSALTALGAELTITGPGGRRRTAVADFVRGAMATTLMHDEILDGISLPKLSARARSGYHKICRKTGEFAEAIGVAVFDPQRGVCRVVVGAGGGRPVVIEDSGGSNQLLNEFAERRSGRERLAQAGVKGDDYQMQIHMVAVRRAVQELMRA
ncbi:MAG: FAD binding domain-containing protein [Xanthobacteraceae bacterium]